MGYSRKSLRYVPDTSARKCRCCFHPVLLPQLCCGCRPSVRSGRSGNLCSVLLLHSPLRGYSIPANCVVDCREKLPEFQRCSLRYIRCPIRLHSHPFRKASRRLNRLPPQHPEEQASYSLFLRNSPCTDTRGRAVQVRPIS